MFVVTNNNMVYTSKDFDGHRSADYTLFIRVGHTGNAFAILDSKAQLKLFTTAESLEVDDTKLTELLNLPFGQVKIVAPDQNYSFVPAEAFDESHLTTYKRYFPDDGLSDPLVSTISPLDVRLIYQIDRLGLDPFIAKFSEAAVYPAIQSFLCGVRTLGTQMEAPLLALDKAGSIVRISFFKSGRFCYCNNFEVNGVTDFNYYLLTLLNHFELGDEQPQFLLSGDIVLADPYYQCIEKYSDVIDFADIEQLTGISVPPVLQHEQHRYLPLFGLHICE